MEDANYQDDNIGIDNNNGIMDESSDTEVEDREDEDKPPIRLDNIILQRLKQDDSGVTNLRVPLNDSYFNSIDWKVDGNCIANNTQLKKLRISYCSSTKLNYWLGEEGDNLPTREQLRGLFSCIYQNSSIASLTFSSIKIYDEFGENLIEGLCGNQLEKLEFGQGRLGSMWCGVLVKVLNHPESKVKHLLLPNCQLDDETLGALCNKALLGNSTLKKLDLSGNKFTSIGWRALSAVIHHPNCKFTELSLSWNDIEDERAIFWVMRLVAHQ